jgi:hypothetical protein
MTADVTVIFAIGLAIEKRRSEMGTQAIQQSQNLTVIEPTIHGEASGPGSDGWQ